VKTAEMWLPKLPQAQGALEATRRVLKGAPIEALAGSTLAGFKRFESQFDSAFQHEVEKRLSHVTEVAGHAVAAKLEAEIARGAQWLRAQPGRLAGQTAQTLARQLGIREDSAQLALDAAERKLRIGRGPMVLPFVNVRAPGRPGNHYDLRTGRLLPGPVNAPVAARRLVHEALKGM
jgi:hypothetical protein